MGFSDLLDPVLGPLLNIPSFWAIFIIAFIISFFITIIYKLMTDQHVMKSLKDDLKKHQEEMKKHRENPEKLMKIQKVSMEKNMQYMMQSFKPTLVTFIPIILIFGWLNTHFGFVAIMPNEEFSTTLEFDKDAEGIVKLLAPDGIEVIGSSSKEVSESVRFTMKGEAGEYIIEYNYDDKNFQQEVLITEEQKYKKPITPVKGEDLDELRVNLVPIKPFGDFSIFGWKPGWLGTYIILSLIFSMSLRKIMKLS